MNKIKDKIAIIGFGASGFGTYLGLKEKGFKKIYIYNQTPYKKEIEVNEWSSENLKTTCSSALLLPANKRQHSMCVQLCVRPLVANIFK